MKLNRHVAILVVCGAIIFTCGVFANKAWNNQVFKAQAAQYVQDVKDSKRAKDEQNERDKLTRSCNNQITYYNNLTVAQKKTIAAPNCSLEEIQ